MSRAPYPLSWPEGVPRARFREQSRFDKSRGFTTARDGTYHELDLFGASHVVITSNLPVGTHGRPYVVGSGVRTVEDPGIAVWWAKKGAEHVLACDRWLSPVENMRAIEATLTALRGISRWGTSEMVEKAFAGFAALPAGDGTDGYMAPEHARPQTWRELFGVNIAPWNDLPKADLLAVVKARHREEIKLAHPDHGGSLEKTAQLNAALQAAEMELR